MDVAVSDRIARLLGSEVVRTTRVSGGDVAESYRVVLDDSRSVFVKTHRSPPPLFFDTESVGLRWLRVATAPDDVIAVPEVLAVDEVVLALDWIDDAGGRVDAAADERFGRGLARLHRRPWTGFGRDDRRTTGSRALPNEPCADWSEFFATQRLLPLARLARDSNALSGESVRRLISVAGSLDGIGASNEDPVLLHGDLWAGNRLVDRDGRNWLIDPAAHGGHREFDLAMMRLFGGFGAASFGAYENEFPLADGWAERVPLHQLAPLVVHAIKFGGGYASAVDRALDAAERLG